MSFTGARARPSNPWYTNTKRDILSWPEVLAQFPLVQRYSYNFRDNWKADHVSGTPLLIKGRESVVFSQTGAVVFVFQNGAEKFSLEIAMDGKIVGLNLVVAPVKLSLQERTFWQRSALFASRTDRICKPLRSGVFVSATLKKRVELGEVQYAVEVKIMKTLGTGR